MLAHTPCPTTTALERILGPSEAAQRIRDFAARAAAVDATVLLTGESGTGKGLLAHAIHDCSQRARGAFVAINCAGVPETLFESEFFGHIRGAFTGAQQAHRGLLEQAHGGTLFLDEIGELSPHLQAKLLTALEDGTVRRLGGERTTHVNARIIAATGADLDAALRAGTFRRDLYHRLHVLVFHLPPLREREGDLDFFVEYFLQHYATTYARPLRGVEPTALARLRAHAWPGNIRELDHAIAAAILACDGPRIRAQHLPRDVWLDTTPAHEHAHGAAAPGGAQRYSFYGSPDDERHHIENALRQHRGNKTRAAAALGMARNTLRLKLRQHGLAGAWTGAEAAQKRANPSRLTLDTRAALSRK